MLYIPCDSCQEHGELPCGRPATPAEILAAARPLVDLEAAVMVWASEWGTEYEDEDRELVKVIVLAALGADDE